MNDNELEDRVREAFDSFEVPPLLLAKARESIRSSEEESAEADSARESGMSSSSSAKVVRLESRARHDADEPGQAVTGKRIQPRLRNRLIGAVAACLVAIVALFGVVRLGTEPTAFVGLDINPSIELQVNRFDTVIAVEGMNEDGRAMAADLALAGLPFDEALEAIASSDGLAAYLDDDGFIALSVSSDDKAQEQKLMGQGEACLASLPLEGSCDAVSMAFRDEAHARGMGCGRYAAALELASLDDSVSLDDCAHLTMRQLRDRIAQCCGDAGSGEGDGTAASGHGQGHGLAAGDDSGSAGMHHRWRRS